MRLGLLSLALMLTAGCDAYGGPLDGAVTQNKLGETAADTFPCTVASITDGDTFRCEETGKDGKQIRIRLSGVAARERDGSCSPGHPCPAASAGAATAALSDLALGQRLSCKSVGSTYDRIAAFCSTPAGVDLSCAMVASGTATKWDRYWGRHTC